MSGYGFTAGYDDEDRLVSWERADTALDQSWALSPVGNWNSFTENTNTQNRTHSPANEILTAASENVHHNAKGNTTLILHRRQTTWSIPVLSSATSENLANYSRRGAAGWCHPSLGRFGHVGLAVADREGKSTGAQKRSPKKGQERMALNRRKITVEASKALREMSTANKSITLIDCTIVDEPEPATTFVPH